MYRVEKIIEFLDEITGFSDGTLAGQILMTLGAFGTLVIIFLGLF
jgi:hypothetical protein